MSLQLGLRARRTGLAAVAAVVMAGITGPSPASAEGPEESANCTIPTLDDRCEASVSALRDTAFPVDMVAAGSRVYSLVTGWRLRAADADTGAVIWDTQLVPAGPGNFVSSLTAAPDGSALYAAGTIDSRATVVRVSPEGATQWVRTASDLKANGARIGVTPDGSRVVVTTNDLDAGRIVSMGLDASDGAELWRGAADIPGSEFLVEHAISPDGSAVYAAAYVFDLETGKFTGAVAAFDIGGTPPFGRQVWSMQLGNGPFDMLYDIALSPDGSMVYAAGSREQPDGTVSASVTAIRSDGTYRWGAEYRGSNGSNEAFGIAVSPSGDKLYVAGQYSTPAKTDDLDAVVVGLGSANGTPLWTLKYGPPGLDDERFFDVAVSPDGSRVYATGISGASNGVNGTTVRVGDAVTLAANSQTGAQLWAGRFQDSANTGSRDVGNAVVVGGNGTAVHVLASLATSRFSSDVPQLTSFRNEVGFLTYAA